jgi:hypothetical protein
MDNPLTAGICLLLVLKFGLQKLKVDEVSSFYQLMGCGVFYGNRKRKELAAIYVLFDEFHILICFDNLMSSIY